MSKPATQTPVSPANRLEVAEITRALAEPFDPTEVKFKPGVISGNRALALAYIDARVIQDRLDEVLGVEGWQDDYECREDGSVICRLRLRLGDEWVTKVDIGGPSEQPDGGDRLKAAFSDALKRAAVKFGLGRYLYRLPGQWVDYDSATSGRSSGRRRCRCCFGSPKSPSRQSKPRPPLPDRPPPLQHRNLRASRCRRLRQNPSRIRCRPVGWSSSDDCTTTTPNWPPREFVSPANWSNRWSKRASRRATTPTCPPGIRPASRWPRRKPRRSRPRPGNGSRNARKWREE